MGRFCEKVQLLEKPLKCVSRLIWRKLNLARSLAKTMDYEYDENLSVNDFFRMLKSKHQILLDTAPMENFVILIPRRGSLPDVRTLETDFILSHVLIPNDELPGSHFTTLMGEKVSVSGDGKRILVETAAGEVEALILFEEVIYTKDSSKYRVWCINMPIGRTTNESGGVRKTNPSTDLYTVLTSHDAGQLLANEINSQTVFKRIQAICRDYVTVNSSQNFSMDQLRDSIQVSYSVKEFNSGKGNFQYLWNLNLLIDCLIRQKLN